MARTIVGLYDSFEDARNVRDALVNAQVKRNDVSIVAANADNRYSDVQERTIESSEYNKYYRQDGDDKNGAAEGALTGGLIGGIGAAVVGVLIPGAGPLTVTGWLVTGLIGAAAGAITGGLLGTLVDAGVDEEHAELYSEGVRRGYALVTVRSDDQNADRIRGIMADHGALNIEQRAAFWEQEGWTGEYNQEDSVYSLDEIEAERRGYNDYSSNSGNSTNGMSDRYSSDRTPDRTW